MGWFLAGGALALVYLLRYCWRADSWEKTWVKTGALGLPVIGVALGGWPILFTLGLAFCVLGDFLLSRPGEGALRAGIGAFALGHILYVVAIALGFGPLVPVWPVLAALGILALSTEVWLAPHAGALRWPVRIYVMLIVVMAGVATSTGNRWVVCGALAFVASDLILSLELFRRPGGVLGWAAPVLIWTLYVLAQGLMIVGFAPLGGF